MNLVYIVFRYVCLQRYCLERHKSNLFTYLIILAMLVFFPSKYCCGCFFLLYDQMEKEMSTFFCTLGWRIPWTEEPGRLQSMGSQRVRYDCATISTFKYTGIFDPYYLLFSQLLPIVLFLLSHQVANHVHKRSQ